MHEMSELITAAAHLFASIATLAVAVVVFTVSRKWFRRLGETGGSSMTDAERRDMEALDRECEREVGIRNGMRGMAPGWGAYHGQKGSGLHRGRR